MSEQPHTTKEVNIKEAVLDRLKEDSVAPRSKLWFYSAEYVVWFLWGLSVLLGAIAFSVIEMVWSVRSPDIYMVTHESSLEFVLYVLPYIWLSIFAIMTVVAYYNLRQTKRGYKYPFTHIIVSCFLFSVVGGLVLQAAGIGSAIDRELGKRMPIYTSQEKLERELWQVPNEGRIVGVLTEQHPSYVDFADLDGTIWQLVINELHQSDKEQLLEAKRVRVIGIPATSSTRFYACGVFPWLFANSMPRAEIAKEREIFIERMSEHTSDAERVEALEESVAVEHTTGRCAQLAVMQRIKALLE